MSAASSSAWSQVSLPAGQEGPGSTVKVECPLPPAQGSSEVEEFEVKITVRRKSTKAAVVASASVSETAAAAPPSPAVPWTPVLPVDRADAPNPPTARSGYWALLQGVRGPQCPPNVHNQERYYLVLRNDLHPSLRGLWCGTKGVTWRRVESTLRGGRLAGSGAKLKRVQDVQEGQALWAATYGEPLVQWVVE